MLDQVEDSCVPLQVSTTTATRKVRLFLLVIGDFHVGVKVHESTQCSSMISMSMRDCIAHWKVYSACSDLIGLVQKRNSLKKLTQNEL